MSAIPGVAFVAAVTLVFALTVRHVSWAPAALVILTAADLGFWGLRYVYREPPREIRDLTSSLTQLAGPGMRVWVEGDWGDRPLLKDYEIVPGYLGLYPATVRDGKSDAFRILSGARWTLTKEGAVIPYPDARPRVWLEDAQFAMLDGARVAIDNPGHIVVKTTAHVPTVLAVAERFDNGWRVSVDGTDTAAVRVGSDFLGVSVPAGSHRVEFLFAPRSFAIGQALSALGGLLLIGVIMVSIRAGSRRDRDPAR